MEIALAPISLLSKDIYKVDMTVLIGSWKFE